MRASSRQPGRLGADERRVLLHEMTAFPVVSALISEYISDLRLELRIRLYVRESSCRVRLAALVSLISHHSRVTSLLSFAHRSTTYNQRDDEDAALAHVMNIIAKRLMTVPCQPTQRPRGQAPLDRGEGLKSVRGALRPGPAPSSQVTALEVPVLTSAGHHPHLHRTLHTSHKHSPHRHKLQGPNWSLPGSHMLINIQHRFATTCSHTDSMHPPSRPLLRPPSSLLPARCTIGHPSPQCVASL